MYTPLMIANTMASRNPGTLTFMKICKLVQQVQGWALAYGRNICIEAPACWMYGPVHDSLYRAYQNLGVTASLQIVPDMVAAPGQTNASMVPSSDEWTISIIDQVMNLYGHLSAQQLSHLLNRSGTPWHRLYGSKPRMCGRLHGTEISNKALYDWFSALRLSAEAEQSRKAA